MSKIYNTAFQFGVVFNILLFTLLNLISFIISQNEIEKIERSPIRISGDTSGIDFGFPFAWGETYFGVVEGAGTILNVIILVVFGFAFGFLFKFIDSKISLRRLELKQLL